MTRLLCWVLALLMSGVPNVVLAEDCYDECCQTKAEDNGNGEAGGCGGEDDECEGEGNQIDADNDPASVGMGVAVGSSVKLRPARQNGGRNSAALAFGRFQAGGMKSATGANYSGPLGVGVTHNYNIVLTDRGSSVRIMTWNGSERFFVLNGTNYNSTSGGDTKLFKEDDDFVWELRRGTRYYFDSAHSNRLASIEDTVGNIVTLSYNADYQLTNATDGNGRSLTFGYDGDGRLDEVTDPIGRTTTYTYDSIGQMTNETDALGLKFAYTYHSTLPGRVTSVTDANGNWMARYGYNDAGKLVADTNAMGYAQYFAYNDVARTATVTNRNEYTYTDYFSETRRLVQRDNWAGTKYYERDEHNHTTNVVDRLGNHWQHIYQSEACGCGAGVGRVMSIDPLDRVNQWAYETNFNLRSAFTNAAGKVTRWYYDDNGSLTNATDALGKVTHFRYDTLGNRTNITDALGRATRFAYDIYGNLSNTVNALNQTMIYRHDIVGRLTNHVDALNRWTDYTYDARDRLTRLVNAVSTNAWAYDGNGNRTAWTNALNQVTSYAYDAANQLRSVTLPTSGVPVARYGYDGNGNRIAATNALGNVTHYGFDGTDRLVAITNALNKVWFFEYDAEGQRTASADPNSHENHFGYDAAGQFTSMTNALDQVIRFQYDLVGNRTNIIDGRGNPLGFAYDAVNRLTNIIYAANDKERFEYDAVGNLTKFITRGGESVSFQYDAANRLTAKSQDGGVYANSWSFSHDAAGRLTHLEDDYQTFVTFSYDANGRLTNETSSLWGWAGPYSVGYQYDAVGRRTKLIYPDGTFVTYGYNANGWLTNISDGGTNTIVSYEYDSAGRRTKRTLQNSTFTVLEYDNASQLTNIWHRQISGGSTNTISRYLYGFDDAGNRNWVKRANGKGDVYKYDATDQLTNVLYEASNPDGSPSGWTNAVGYCFDAAGNRTQVVSSVSGTSVYAVNTLNQYTSVGGQGLDYDSNGNLYDSGELFMEYDIENRLQYASRTGSSETWLYYDGLGRVAGQDGLYLMRFVYDDQWRVIAEYNLDQGGLTAKYVYGPGIDEVVRMTRNGTNYYYHHAALDTVTEITSTNGTVMEQYGYDVYGQPMFKDGNGNPISASAIGNRFLFQGREYDHRHGLYNFRYRYYSPTLGRFVQVDPIRELGGINLYAFAVNDPLLFIDPYGLSFMGRLGNGLTGAGAGAGAGALAGAAVGAGLGALGAGAGAAPGALAGATAGAIAGAIGGFVAGFLSDPCFKPADAAMDGAIAGGLAGLTGGAGAVGGVAAGAGAGAVAGGTSAGLSTGGDLNAIGIGAVVGAGFGGLGGAARNLDSFAENLFYGTSEVIGQDVGGYMNFIK